MPVYGFNQRDSKRIGKVVKRVEAMPEKQQILGRTHRNVSEGSGVEIKWAKVTAVTDANNYTVAIYDRSDEETALESGKQCRVFDVVDELAEGDWIPVRESTLTGEDYECIQQLGVLG